MSEHVYTTRNAEAQVMDPGGRPNTQRIEHAPHPGDSEDAAAYTNIVAARVGWDRVEIEVTVVGWFRPDGQLWQPTDAVTLYSKRAFPVGSHKMQLGAQEVTWSQQPNDQGEGTTTTLRLVLPQFLTPVGHAYVQADGAGNIIGATPQPAQPVPPDTGQ